MSIEKVTCYHGGENVPCEIKAVNTTHIFTQCPKCGYINKLSVNDIEEL